MSLEQRLQHAARELRGVEIPVPPLGGARASGRPRRLQMVAVPVLFVVGGMMAVNGVRQDVAPPPVDSDIVQHLTTTETPVDHAPTPSPSGPTVVAPPDRPPAGASAPADVRPAAPNARAEMEIIAEVRNRQRLAESVGTGTGTGGGTADGDLSEPGPRSPGQRLGDVDAFGPI